MTPKRKAYLEGRQAQSDRKPFVSPYTDPDLKSKWLGGWLAEEYFERDERIAKMGK